MANKVFLMGRLTKDPELRYTNANNTAVCSFTLAVDRRFSKNEADFINIVAWDKNAEFCSKYFTKGQKVVVVGRIQTRSWDDNEGKKRHTVEVMAEESYFAESKKAGQEQGGIEDIPGIEIQDNDCDLPF